MSIGINGSRYPPGGTPLGHSTLWPELNVSQSCTASYKASYPQIAQNPSWASVHPIGHPPSLYISPFNTSALWSRSSVPW